jgi:hypothetical protein
MRLPEDILHCDQVALAHNNPIHPCHQITRIQHSLGDGVSYQVSEPWCGDIRAPLLFVSSDPSIDLLDDAPWSDRPLAELAGYYKLVLEYTGSLLGAPHAFEIGA